MSVVSKNEDEPSTPIASGTTEPAGGASAPRVSLRAVTQNFVSDDGSETHALGPVDLDVEPGSFVTIAGPSGCGKTTLLRLIAGFSAPTSGTVTLGGQPIEGPGADRGVVFQQANLFPWLSVAGNVEYGPKRRKVPKAERRALVAEYLELVGLAGFEDHKPYELSGGMQQRVQLARVLVNRPKIILMDEPFGALDAITRDRLQDELRRIWAQTGATILFITHSIDEAVYLGTRTLVMSPRPGTIVRDIESPLPAERSPELRETPDYLDLRHELNTALAH